MVSRKLTCSAITSGVQPCRNRPLRSEDHCFFHSKTTKEVRVEAARRGGSRGKPWSTEAGLVKNSLDQLYEEVKSGRLDVRRAAVLAQVANGMLRAISVEKDLRLAEQTVVPIEDMLEMVSMLTEAVRRCVPERDTQLRIRNEFAQIMGLENEEAS